MSLSPPADVETPPERWGPLKVLEPIGAGANGVVYRAWDPRLDREVALKLVPASASAEPGSSASSMLRERRLLARVRHPNVVTVHGADRIGDAVGVWMELIRGRTLGDLVRQGRVFPPREVARIGLEIARAVEAVHNAGLLHRDIKTQNVMRGDDGRIVLMDFGAGRDLDGGAGDSIGTPLFVAPEVLHGDPATERSDLYIIGVVLYHIATGRYPVEGRGAKDVRAAHVSGARTPLSARPAGLPPALVHIIDRCLHTDPRARYDSARALSRDLESFLHPAPLARVTLPFTAALLAVTVWLVVEATFVPHAPPVPAERLVVAVLPFASLGRGPDDDLVADGLTAELVRSLAAIDGLEVRPPSRSERAEPAALDISSAGQRVGATMVLSGAVLASRDELRVTAQLVRVEDATLVWSDSVTRTGVAVVSTHEQIAAAIVNRLRLRVWPRQRRYQIDPDVYYQYLRARGLLARRHVENAGRAATLFEDVIAREPVFAPAWAGLASALGAFSRAVPGDTMPPRNPRMAAAALEAIRLDPLLADAQAALGALHAQDREWDRAQTAFETGLTLNPSLTTIHTDFVLAVLLPTGQLEAALQLLTRAAEVDPLSLDVRRVRALIEIDSGRYQEGIDSARWVLDHDPTFPFADIWLGRGLVLAGRPDEAVATFQRSPDRFGYLGYLFAVTGRRADAEALAAAYPEFPVRQMLVYAGLGDIDRALDALERTEASNWWLAATWLRRPEAALLRGHPRTMAVERRLGLLAH